VKSILSAGESWAPGVQKMLAVHETDGELGVIYLDLFPRSALFPCKLIPVSVVQHLSLIFGQVMQKSCAIALCSHKRASLAPSWTSVSILKESHSTAQGQYAHGPACAQLQGQTSMLKSANSIVWRIHLCLPFRMHMKDMVSFTQNVYAPSCVQAGKIRTGSAFHIAVWATAEEQQISDPSHCSGLQL